MINLEDVATIYEAGRELMDFFAELNDNFNRKYKRKIGKARELLPQNQELVMRSMGAQPQTGSICILQGLLNIEIKMKSIPARSIPTSTRYCGNTHTGCQDTFLSMSLQITCSPTT